VTATLHEIDSFAQFAKDHVVQGGADATIDELFDHWRTQNPPPKDLLAIKAAIRDIENGETGQPYEEFAAEFRVRNNIPDRE